VIAPEAKESVSPEAVVFDVNEVVYSRRTGTVA
jgi:hypothetical protein